MGKNISVAIKIKIELIFEMIITHVCNYNFSS